MVAEGLVCKIVFSKISCAAISCVAALGDCHSADKGLRRTLNKGQTFDILGSDRALAQKRSACKVMQHMRPNLAS